MDAVVRAHDGKVQMIEGFETPETAAQTEARLTQARNTAAAEFGAVRADAKPVDITDVIATIGHAARAHLAKRDLHWVPVGLCLRATSYRARHPEIKARS